MPFINRITMKIELRNLYFDDYFGLKEAMIEAYAGIGGDYWQLDDIKKITGFISGGATVRSRRWQSGRICFVNNR